MKRLTVFCGILLVAVAACDGDKMVDVSLGSGQGEAGMGADMMVGGSDLAKPTSDLTSADKAAKDAGVMGSDKTTTADAGTASTDYCSGVSGCCVQVKTGTYGDRELWIEGMTSKPYYFERACEGGGICNLSAVKANDQDPKFWAVVNDPYDAVRPLNLAQGHIDTTAFKSCTYQTGKVKYQDDIKAGKVVGGYIYLLGTTKSADGGVAKDAGVMGDKAVAVPDATKPDTKPVPDKALPDTAAPKPDALLSDKAVVTDGLSTSLQVAKSGGTIVTSGGNFALYNCVEFFTSGTVVNVTQCVTKSDGGTATSYTFNIPADKDGEKYRYFNFYYLSSGVKKYVIIPNGANPTVLGSSIGMCKQAVSTDAGILWPHCFTWDGCYGTMVKVK